MLTKEAHQLDLNAHRMKSFLEAVVFGSSAVEWLSSTDPCKLEAVRSCKKVNF